MIDAVRAIRALEDGEEVPPSFDDDVAYLDEEEEGEGARKRARIGDGPATMDDEDDDAPPAREESPPPQASGLLNAETMQGLKLFAQMKQARGGAASAPAVVSKPASKPVSAMGGLGDYGSDEEDD